MICQSVRCFNGLTCRTKWSWVFIPISDEKLNRCKYVICPVSPLRAKLSEVKRRLPVVTGTMAGQQVNINIMEYSERNVRQLTLNEQEDTSPGKLMLV
ncbi:hypothetical protein BWR13_13345 [Escherichia coli]|nr:hypothetical protein BWR13_13345 [Escherichia coli]